MISIKFKDGTFNVNKDDLLNSTVISNLLNFSQDQCSELDLSNIEGCSFLTYENFKSALQLSKKTIDENVLKTLDYFNFEYELWNYDMIVKLSELPLEEVVNERQLELYFKIIDPQLKNFSKVINNVSLDFIKKFINQDNINTLWEYNLESSGYNLCENGITYKNLIKNEIIFRHLICDVPTLEILEYFFECDIHKNVGELIITNTNYNELNKITKVSVFFHLPLEFTKRLFEYGFRFDKDEDFSEFIEQHYDYKETSEYIEVMDYLYKNKIISLEQYNEAFEINSE